MRRGKCRRAGERRSGYLVRFRIASTSAAIRVQGRRLRVGGITGQLRYA